jgi:hypothetical protein
LGRGSPACSPLRNGDPTGATGAVEIVAFIVVAPRRNAPFEGLRFIEAIVLAFSPAAATHARTKGTGWNGFFVVEVGRAARLLGGDAPQTHTFVGEEDGRSSQEELAELKNRIQAPTLEKQNATAEQANGGEKDVVIPC